MQTNIDFTDRQHELTQIGSSVHGCYSILNILRSEYPPAPASDSLRKLLALYPWPANNVLKSIGSGGKPTEDSTLLKWVWGISAYEIFSLIDTRLRPSWKTWMRNRAFAVCLFFIFLKFILHNFVNFWFTLNFILFSHLNFALWSPSTSQPGVLFYVVGIQHFNYWRLYILNSHQWLIRCSIRNIFKTKPNMSKLDVNKNALLKKVFKLSANKRVAEVSPDAKYKKKKRDDYHTLLKDLHCKIMTMDENEVQDVVDVVAKTGIYKVTDVSFDFDLEKLSEETIRKLQSVLKIPSRK